MQSPEIHEAVSLEVTQATSHSSAEVEKNNLWLSLRTTAGAAALALVASVVPHALEVAGHADEAQAVAVDNGADKMGRHRLRNCPVIIGHRGSVGPMRKPFKDFTTENTLWSTRRAQLWGADGGEQDVRDSVEKTSWLMHDGTVDRTTDGHGAIKNMKDARIARLRTPDGSPVPLYEDGSYLRDVLSTGWANSRKHPRRLKANILNWRFQLDTKDVSNLPDYVATTHEVVSELEGVDPSKVIMWTTDKLRDAQRIHELDPDAEIGRIFYTGRPSRRMINTSARGRTPFTSFNVHEVQIKRDWVMDARQHGMDVLARTVNDVPTAKRVIDAGVTYIVTDNVPKVNAWNLDRLGICKAIRKNMPVITPPDTDPTPTDTPTPTPSPTETSTPAAPTESAPSDAATLSEVSVSSTEELFTSSATPTTTP